MQAFNELMGHTNVLGAIVSICGAIILHEAALLGYAVFFAGMAFLFFRRNF